MTLFAGNFEVKYSGTLHLRSLYVKVHDWFVDKEYMNPPGPDFPETLYSLSKSQPGGQEMWIWWRPTWAPQGNPFYRYVLRVTFHSFKMSDVETVVGNRKIAMQKGEHKVIITALLETDYTGKWRNSKLMSKLYQIFWKRIIWNDIEHHKKGVLNHAYQLQTAIKEFFGQPHHQDISRPYAPKLGMNEQEPLGP